MLKDILRLLRIIKKIVLVRLWKEENQGVKILLRNKKKIKNFWGRLKKLILVWVMKKIKVMVKFIVNGKKIKIDLLILVLSNYLYI